MARPIRMATAAATASTRPSGVIGCNGSGRTKAMAAVIAHFEVHACARGVLKHCFERRSNGSVEIILATRLAHVRRHVANGDCRAIAFHCDGCATGF